jgi:nucleotide-binding universal stress UspA family protein
VSTIVVPLDQSRLADAAAPVASTLAQRMGGTSLALVVVSSPGVDLSDDEMYLRKQAALASVPSTIRVLYSNDVVDALLSEINSYPEPLVCMGAHGRSRLGSALLGSVSEAIIRRSGVPVVVVGSSVNTAAAPDRVTVCLDGSTVAEAAIAPAVELARRLRSSVELFHAHDRMSPSDARSYLRGIADQITGVQVHPTYEIGGVRGPGHAIIAHAWAGESGILAMGTHGRSGLQRMTAGSVTQQVVHRAPCPVLVVHPGD